MKKNSLSKSGLSLSQAQSISNLCFQAAQDIGHMIAIINNAEKTLTINTGIYIEQKGNKIPGNFIGLIIEKAKLHATQAFLMENIKAKDTLLKELKKESFTHNLEIPRLKELQEVDLKQLVDETWAWEQLSAAEYNEYLECEAYAAHIGQVIHKDSKLDTLRKELAYIKTLEWITIEDGKRSPLTVTVHHTSEELLNIHNELAAMHRKYEQRVNYFKAKIKNLVTEENARISRDNAVLIEKVNVENDLIRRAYSDEIATFNDSIKKLREKFEEDRYKKIQDAAALRIEVDSRFQDVVDKYLKQIEDK
jgi:hypothetical protein